MRASCLLHAFPSLVIVAATLAAPLLRNTDFALCTRAILCAPTLISPPSFRSCPPHSPLRALVSAAQIVFSKADLELSSGIEIETDDWLTPQPGSLVITIEMSAPNIEGFVLNADVLAGAVADATGIDADELSVAVTNGDLCLGLTKRECRQKKPRRWLSCRWADGLCAKKNPDVVQPIPLVCTEDCCELNKRACKGAGVHARKWSWKYKMNPKRSCKYTKDKSMQNKTPDGKCNQHRVMGLRPSLVSSDSLCPFGWSSLRAR